MTTTAARTTIGTSTADIRFRQLCEIERITWEIYGKVLPTGTPEQDIEYERCVQATNSGY